MTPNDASEHAVHSPLSPPSSLHVLLAYRIVQCYVEGLAWVLAYYYQGCQSWQWYYPYHYSPFAADFTDLGKLKVEFTLGQPFKPYEQLMGVFPAASRSHIPAAYHELMTSDDSPIKDFYPEEFEIDMNGKKMLWQGIALLPFIEQTRLLDSMKIHEHLLTPEDKMRNDMGSAVVFCSEGHPQYDNFCNMYRKRTATDVSQKSHCQVFHCQVLHSAYTCPFLLANTARPASSEWRIWISSARS